MTTIVIVLALLAAAAAAGAAAVPVRRRARLRARFGPEYDAALARYGERRLAEQELIRRQRTVGQLAIRPLDDDARAAHTARWTAAQERFVDEPAAAVADAQALVAAAMRARGYPEAALDERLALLSVDHAYVLAHYRAALVLLGDAAPGTEDLRRAMLHLREVFRDVVAETPREPAPAGDRVTGR